VTTLSLVNMDQHPQPPPRTEVVGPLVAGGADNYFGAGVINISTPMDDSSAERFSESLWLEAPGAHQFVNLHMEFMTNPLNLTDLADMLSLIGS